MELTTQDIIKMLPFEESFKIELLQHYDLLTPDQKHDIEEIIWQLYGDIYDLKLEENMHLALIRAKHGQESLDEQFYRRVEEKTDKDMAALANEKIQETDLLAARKAMELIIKEITAAKKN